MGLGDQRRDSMMNEDMTHFGQGQQVVPALLG